jgi:tRNA pseudouridine38-40 synthase
MWFSTSTRSGPKPTQAGSRYSPNENVIQLSVHPKSSNPRSALRRRRTVGDVVGVLGIGRSYLNPVVGWCRANHERGRVQRRPICTACAESSRYNDAVPRFKLTIEYAGTRYSGWQIQKNARTVQGEIDRAVRTVTQRKDFELYGSGRTDAGVHASGQIAHLDVATPLPPESLRRRLNDELPADINLLRIQPVPHRFHARHDAVARRYLYQIARRRTAFAKAYVWWVKDPIDVALMREAGRAFVGMRDFQSFAASDDEEGPAGQTDRSTLVLIDRVAVVEADDLVLVGIEGSHFLWKMVRRIVGVLVETGRGALDPLAAATFLRESSGEPARLTAPPSGLFLDQVFYAGDPRTEMRPITPIKNW